MLPHHVYAVGKYLRCVQRAAAFPGIQPSVGRFSLEFDIHVLGGRRAEVGHVSPGHWVPVEHRIDVVKHSFAGHEDFGPFRFLSGGTVDAKRAGNFFLLHQVLDGQRGPHCSGTNQVMSTAVTCGDPVPTWLLLGNRLVAQPGQSVILQQDAQLWLTLAIFGNEGRGDVGRSFAGNLEAIFLQKILEVSRRLRFQ